MPVTRPQTAQLVDKLQIALVFSPNSNLGSLLAPWASNFECRPLNPAGAVLTSTLEFPPIVVQSSLTERLGQPPATPISEQAAAVRTKETVPASTLPKESVLTDAHLNQIRRHATLQWLAVATVFVVCVSLGWWATKQRENAGQIPSQNSVTPAPAISARP